MLGTDPKYICTRPATANKGEAPGSTVNSSGTSSSGQRNTPNSRTGNDGASSEDDDDEDEESSTTSSNMKNGATDNSSGDDKHSSADSVNSDLSKTPVPLVDYVLNVVSTVYIFAY